MQILDRNNKLVAFNINKVLDSIYMAGLTSKEIDKSKARSLAKKVETLVKLRTKNNVQFHIEDIADMTEEVLIIENYVATAKVFMNYREKRRGNRQSKQLVSDVMESIDDYLDQKDWRVKANSNQGYSLGGLILNLSGKITANYILTKILPRDIGDLHRSGAIHIHDLDMLSGYCAGWSLRALLTEGFNGIPGKVDALPPKHLGGACGQMVNFMGSLQNEWAGAQAFSSVDTYLAPYVKKDNLTYEQVEQQMQHLVWNLNVGSRWGCVDEETELLTINGFKKYNELNKGDLVYTYNNGNLNIQPIKNLNIYDYSGDLHKYSGRDICNILTPNHRVVYKKNNSNDVEIKLSEELFNYKTPLTIPVAANLIRKDYDISDNHLKLITWILTEGSIDYRNSDTIKCIHIYKSKSRWGLSNLLNLINKCSIKYRTKEYVSKSFGSEMVRVTINKSDIDFILNKINYTKKDLPNWFMFLSRRQARLVLKLWTKLDGQEYKFKCQADNVIIQNKLQQLGVIAGYGSTTYNIKNSLGVRFYTRKFKNLSKKELVNYTGKVWCPTTEDGIVIFRKDGSIFISGNSQTPFTNFTFDLTCPDDLKDQYPVIGGEYQEFTYGELQNEMDMINRAYLSVMIKGDRNGKVFTFPIPTYNITKDFNWDSPVSDLLFEVTAKYGLPYFQNFLNSELSPHMIRSMCCRLQLDLTELLKRGNGLFGSAEQTGSVAVVTINCARLGYEYKGQKRKLMSRLNFLLNQAKTVLEIRRKTVQTLMDQGLYPYSKRYLGTLRNHFSTIGVNGMHEMILNFTDGKYGIENDKGKQLALDVLSYIRKKLTQFQKQTGHMYNLEATPAEGTTYRFAKEDKSQYPDIIQSGFGENIYYTNSSQLPVDYTDDVFEVFDHQEILQKMYTGGTVQHIYVGERMTKEGAKSLVRKILSTYRIPYITISPTFSICPIHGYLSGEHEYCPICDSLNEQSDDCCN